MSNPSILKEIARKFKESYNASFTRPDTITMGREDYEQFCREYSNNPIGGSSPFDISAISWGGCKIKVCRKQRYLRVYAAGLRKKKVDMYKYYGLMYGGPGAVNVDRPCNMPFYSV